MKFLRGYKRTELDRADGMNFHPTCGLSISDLGYDEERHQFFIAVRGSGWTFSDDINAEHYPRISDERGMYMPDDEYPEHWKFDPWTGKELWTRWSAF